MLRKAATVANGPTRRERVRKATCAEIRENARDLLVEEGTAAVTFNAVARRMGISGPALYRYYGSQGELFEALTAEFFGELIGSMKEAAAGPHADTPARRLLALSRALRAWAVAHPAEFGWLFASRVPSSAVAHRCEADSADSGRAFGQVFLDQIVEIWGTRRFPIPSLEDMDPSLAEQLRAYSERIEGRLPAEAAYVFLTAWTRLYGLLCMEVLNQIGFAYSDLEPVYEECLQELCRLLDIAYEPPADKME